MTKGIYKRGKLYWIRYAGLDGRMRFEATHSDKFREAEALLIQRRQSIKEGKQPEPVKKIGQHFFKTLAKDYLAWAERQRGYESKRYFIKALEDAFGSIPLRSFTTMLIEEYQSNKLKAGKKPATVNRHVATLKHMFTKAYEWDMIEEYVWKKVRKVKLLEENNRRLRFLSKEECQNLLEKCDSHVRPIVVTALNTGMRKGEILSLKWENVDMNHGFILLTDTKNGERREIPINETLMTTLKGLPRRIDGKYVFYDPHTDKPYQDVKRSFNTACKKVGIYDFHFHDLRHTFASHLVMAGVDITTVKELLGHKSLAMTMRYAHLAPAHKVKAVSVLDGALNERREFISSAKSV